MDTEVRRGLGVLVIAAFIALVALFVNAISEAIGGLGFFLALLTALIGLWRLGAALLADRD